MKQRKITTTSTNYRTIRNHNLSSASKQKKMKKEWSDAETAWKHGGKRNWPVWVLKLICEFIVNGTSPLAIPANIWTMY